MIFDNTDKNGNSTSYTLNVNDHRSYFKYNSLNQLTKMRLYKYTKEQVTLYQYNSQGLVTKVINTVYRLFM